MTKDEQAELTLLSMVNPKGRLGIDMHTGLGDADLDAAFDRGLSSLWFTFVDLVPSKNLAGEPVTVKIYQLTPAGCAHLDLLISRNRRAQENTSGGA